MTTPTQYRLFGLIFLSLLGTNNAWAGQSLTASAIVANSGNSLVIQGKTIQLYGISVAKLGAFCDEQKKKYDCGLMARSSLLDLTAGATVSCQLSGAKLTPNTYKCLANGYDISEGMIYTGWATPTSDAPKLFETLALKAKQRRLGMWRLKLP